ncbi:hypothetical protein [uncultured Ilyobacter sp.]|uniref:hypothetical protein n=1 Tax=uncultured Ilyobacter sp. TaxID=544433 RepID=UPI0029C6486C|nr:hypothetical protein [uncultured Ilyobacter sp.]
MIKRGMKLLIKSGVFILVLASNVSFLDIIEIWAIETVFLLLLLSYGNIQKKLVKGRYYRYNIMIFSFILASGLMYFAGEISQNLGERFAPLLVAMFLNYYMFLNMSNGLKDVINVSGTFIILGLMTWGIRTVFLYFPEPVLFFKLPPGILFAFALAVGILRKIWRRESDV